MFDAISRQIDSKGAVGLWRTAMMAALFGVALLTWDVREKVGEIGPMEQRQSAIEQRQDRLEVRQDVLEERIYRWDRSGWLPLYRAPQEVPS